MSAPNCKCVQRIEAQLKKNRGAEKAEVIDVDLLSGATFSHMEYKLPEQKRPKKVSLLHSYCPFCGKKYKYGDGIPGLNLEKKP